MIVFTSRLLPLVSGGFCNRVFCPARPGVRALSRAVSRPQQHRVDGTSALTGKVDRFGGVTVDLGELGLPADISESSFSKLLQGWLSCVRECFDVHQASPGVSNSQLTFLFLLIHG